MPKRTHEDSLETKRNILSSAKRLFSIRGYERTSLSDIAKYSGVTRGAIYWHFESKEDLLIELLDSLSREQFAEKDLVDACSESEPDPLGKIKSFLFTAMQKESVKFFTSTFVTMIIAIINGKSGNQELRQRMLEQRQLHNQKIVQALKNAINKGQLPKNLLVETVAEHISMFMTGYIHSCRVESNNSISANSKAFIELEFETIKKITSDLYFD